MRKLLIQYINFSKESVAVKTSNLPLHEMQVYALLGVGSRRLGGLYGQAAAARLAGRRRSFRYPPAAAIMSRSR